MALTIGALGVVFGDIGTSPLYAFNEIFYGHPDMVVNTESIMGACSLVLWTITAIVTLKYLFLVLRADNDGEGGVFALYSLLHRLKRDRMGFLWVLLIAAGLLYGDGVITPAISVLSAVEGLKVATPIFSPYVLTITTIILSLLFFIQRKGTAQVGKLFGPIVFVWFVTLFVFGMRQIVQAPQILQALNPYHGIYFITHAPTKIILLTLGGVMLAVTGGEALYADMGHFGVKPLRRSWLGVVYPALLVNYLGQGAYLLSGQKVTSNNIFFSMIPESLMVPMVILACLAAVIASQALISGAFSLTAQGIALGLFPRLKIVHTHHQHEGQIYAPFVNWSLFFGCVLLVWKFQTSSNLAGAYGLAVSCDMLTTSIAMILISKNYWQWSRAKAISIFGFFALVDSSFLFSNSLKFFDGGYIPLSIGIALFTIMVTWRWGRKATFAAYTGMQTMTIETLIELKENSTQFIERNVVMMVPKPIRELNENAPALLQMYWNRQGKLPRNLIFVEAIHRKTPFMHSSEERYQIKVLQKHPEKGSIVSVTMFFGFMENPNVEAALESLANHHLIDLTDDPNQWIVHVSQENLLPADKLSLWKKAQFKLFSMLRQISLPGHYYYGLGNYVQLTVDIIPVRLG